MFNCVALLFACACAPLTGCSKALATNAFGRRALVAVRRRLFQFVSCNARAEIRSKNVFVLFLVVEYVRLRARVCAHLLRLRALWRNVECSY